MYVTQGNIDPERNRNHNQTKGVAAQKTEKRTGVTRDEGVGQKLKELVFTTICSFVLEAMDQCVMGAIIGLAGLSRGGRRCKLALATIVGTRSRSR